MANNEEETRNISQGNDWEVVSLTESAYASAPGPVVPEVKNDGQLAESKEPGAESSSSLPKSDHFICPPSQHENLSMEPDIHDEQVEKNTISKPDEVGDISGSKFDESWNLNGLDISDEYGGSFLDEKANSLSAQGTEEPSLYTSAALSSLHNESKLVGSTAYGEKSEAPGDVTEPAEGDIDFPRDVKSKSPTKDMKETGSALPCSAWSKIRAGTLYAHVKEASTFWYIFVAAAVMGLVVLGQKRKQERWHSFRVKWQLSIPEEGGTVGTRGTVDGLKSAIEASHHNSPASFYQREQQLK